MFQKTTSMYNKIGVLVLCFLSSMAYAQNGFLRGTVTDGEGSEPMFAANVVQAGSTNGTTTDFDGNYSLTIPEEGINV